MKKENSQKMGRINQKMVDLLGFIGLNQPISIHALAKKINEPYTSIHRQITKMNNIKIVKLEKKGNTNFVSLNFDNELTRHLLSANSVFDKNKFVKKYPLVNIITKTFIFNQPLLVFGSYVKGSPKKHSDIDLCVIGLTAREEKTFKKSLKDIETLHQQEINGLYFKKTEFVAMLKSKTHNVGKEIYLHHLVLKNADKWYGLVNEVYEDVRL